MKRISNYHSHIALCGHAEGTIEDYVKEAIRNNYEEIGISDHAPIPVDFVGKEMHEYLWLSHMMTIDDFYNIYLKELDYCIEKYPNIKILKGLEIEYIENCDNYFQTLYSKVDYFNLGVHYFTYNNKILSSYDYLTEEELEGYVINIEKALSKGWYNCLVHPDLYLYRVSEFTSYHEQLARRIIEACIKNNVYLEINANGKNKYPRKEFWQIVKQYKDAKVIIGSDAHLIKNFHGENVFRAMNFALENEINVLSKMEIRPHQHETIFIGHRGASGVSGVVNNALSGFKEGIRRKYFGLECDVRVSTDGIYYIHHDHIITLYNNNFTTESIEKYNIAPETRLNDLSWEQLKQLDLYYTLDGVTKYDKVILFEDYVKLCKENYTKCIVEFKYTNGINEEDQSKIDGVLDILKKYYMIEDTIFISFMKQPLLYVQKKVNCYDIAYLTGESNTDMESVKWCIENKISIDAYHPKMTKEIVDKMHENNLTVNIWTLNDKDKVDYYKQMGVDYITTDLLGNR